MVNFFDWLEPSEKARYIIMHPAWELKQSKKNLKLFALDLKYFFFFKGICIGFPMWLVLGRVWNLNWNLKETATNNICWWRIPFRNRLLSIQTEASVLIFLSRSHPNHHLHWLSVLNLFYFHGYTKKVSEQEFNLVYKRD